MNVLVLVRNLGCVVWGRRTKGTGHVKRNMNVRRKYFLTVRSQLKKFGLNFATIFVGYANEENNYTIGFAVACQENWRKVGRLIPKGILIDAVHNRDNGYMY